MDKACLIPGLERFDRRAVGHSGAADNHDALFGSGVQRGFRIGMDGAVTGAGMNNALGTVFHGRFNHLAVVFHM